MRLISYDAELEFLDKYGRVVSVMLNKNLDLLFQRINDTYFSDLGMDSNLALVGNISLKKYLTPNLSN